MLLMDKKYPDTELQFVDHTVVFFMLGFEPTILSRNWHGNRLYQTTKTTLRRRIKTELYIKLNYTISGKEWSHDESSAIFKRQELSFMGEYTWRGFDCRRFRVVCKIIVFFLTTLNLLTIAYWIAIVSIYFLAFTLGSTRVYVGYLDKNFLLEDPIYLYTEIHPNR